LKGIGLKRIMDGAGLVCAHFLVSHVAAYLLF
jgi:hypothetical protein